MRSGAVGTLVGILLLAVAGATPARADYRSEFRSGFLAFERGRWAEAAQRMEAATRERPGSDARDLVRIGGTFSKAYLPWFYLGLARAELGDCAGAVEAFDRSEAAGAILAVAEHAELVERRKWCEERLPPRPPASEPAPAPAEAILAAEPESGRDAVPPGLIEAATAFFGGDYRGCLSLLTGLVPDSQALRAQVELFRAAAEFALARSGEPDAGARLRRAREAARRYRAAAAGASPDRRYFSPEFLAFLAGS